MECGEVRDRLLELTTGDLPPEASAPVRAHLAACPACREAEAAEGALRALIRRRAARYPVPPHLRARVSALLEGKLRPRVAWRLRRLLPATPLRAAMAAAIVTVAVGAPIARWALLERREPVEELMAEALNEHIRLGMRDQEEGVPGMPEGLLRGVRGKTDFAFPTPPVRGAGLELRDAYPSFFLGRLVAAFAYRADPEGAVHLFVTPEGDVRLPERLRVQMGRWRPAYAQKGRYAVCVWRQKGLAFTIVADTDRKGMEALYLRIAEGIVWPST